jgi:hypothetical protein
MIEGYDAADPAPASTLALRDEWMNVNGHNPNAQQKSPAGGTSRNISGENTYLETSFTGASCQEGLR